MSLPTATALREALATSPCRFHEDDDDCCAIAAAARLALTVLEHGEDIEWCEAHNREAFPMGYCRYDDDTNYGRGCQMVPSLRIPLSALRIADPNEEE